MQSSPTPTCTTISYNDIHVSVEHSISEEQPCITEVWADIMLVLRSAPTNSIKIGSISALLIDRQKIRYNCFMGEMDERSQELQSLGCLLFEPKYGRIRLESLAEYDTIECEFMYIQKMKVDEPYKSTCCLDGKKGSYSDVGAIAIHKLLHHPFIKGVEEPKRGSWKVTSAIYWLDSKEQMTKEEREEFSIYMTKQNDVQFAQLGGNTTPPSKDEKKEEKKWDEKLQKLKRMDANQFLRNGFFQDETYAKNGGDAASILVASFNDWSTPSSGRMLLPLKTHAQAASIEFCPKPPAPSQPTGMDKELFDFVKEQCQFDPYEGGPTSALSRNQISVQVTNFVVRGASVSRSDALHIACARNSYQLVDMLVNLEPTAVNSFDQIGCTPLMLAAVNALGRFTMHGLSDTKVIDALLGTRCIDKNMTNKKGMTAYGCYKDQKYAYDLMTHTLTGQSLTERSNEARQSDEQIQLKLLPPNGPTSPDLTRGEGPGTGYVLYSDDEDD